MKYKILFLALFVATQITAMSSDDSGRMSTADPADVDRRIVDTIGGAGSVADLQSLCQQRLQMAPAAMPTRGRARKKADEDPLKAAREAAQRNLERAEANLTWCGNSGRRKQVFVGGILLLGGTTALVYNLSQLFNSDVEDSTRVAAGVNLAPAVGAAYGGAKDILLAFENGAAQTEHDKALALPLLIDAMAQGRSGTPQIHVGPAGSSSSSSLMEVVGFADEDDSDSMDGESGSSGGSSESASLANSSGRSSGESSATSHGSSSSSLSTDESLSIG